MFLFKIDDIHLIINHSKKCSNAGHTVTVNVLNQTYDIEAEETICRCTKEEYFSYFPKS